MSFLRHYRSRLQFPAEVSLSRGSPFEIVVNNSAAATPTCIDEGTQRCTNYVMKATYKLTKGIKTCSMTVNISRDMAAYPFSY